METETWEADEYLSLIVFGMKIPFSNPSQLGFFQKFEFHSLLFSVLPNNH